MAKKNQKKKRIMKMEPVPRNCPFDKSGTEPDYKEYEVLAKFLNDRAKILGKDRTGVCSKHQRRLSNEIQKARHLALLPYAPSIGA